MQCIQPRPLQRAVGCGTDLVSSTATIQGALQRFVYDTFPYNSCEVDENVSFRQHMEGFTKAEDPHAPLRLENVLDTLAGSDTHACKWLASKVFLEQT